jgi:hypothetical protein
MNAPVEPTAASPPEPTRISEALRDVAFGLLADGAAIRRMRSSGSAAAFPYDAVLRLTFGTERAAELAGLPKAEVRKCAPIPFAEAFEDVPPEAARDGLAMSILGAAGIVLIVGTVITAGICIDIQLLQSRDPPKGTVTRPNVLPSLPLKLPESSGKPPFPVAPPQQQQPPPGKDGLIQGKEAR